MFGRQDDDRMDEDGPSDRRILEARDWNMDIDQPQDGIATLRPYVAIEEGPARKRTHFDMSTPSRTFSTPLGTLRVTQQTPFLFNSADIPPMPPQTPFPKYDPDQFQAKNFGFGPVQPNFGGSSLFAEDVDMDSPARPERTPKIRTESIGEAQTAVNHDDHLAPPLPNDLPGMDLGQKAKIGTEVSSGSMSNEDEKVENRVYATGGVKRELNRRARKRQQREQAQGDQKRLERNINFHHHQVAPSLRHSEIPALLLGYIQVFINVSMVLAVLYFFVQFVLTVRSDVKDRMQEVSVEILQEIAECTKLYLTNRCDPAGRVPALEAPCKAWEACMAKDPTMVGRVNVMAETFAGVINSFVDPISWKTMGFSLATLSFLVILTNSALWNLRAKAQPVPVSPLPDYPSPHYFQALAMAQQHGRFLAGQTGDRPGHLMPINGPYPAGSESRQIEYPAKKSRFKLW